MKGTNMNNISSTKTKSNKLRKNHLFILSWIKNRTSAIGKPYVDITSESLGKACGVSRYSGWRYVDRLAELDIIRKDVVIGGHYTFLRLSLTENADEIVEKFVAKPKRKSRCTKQHSIYIYKNKSINKSLLSTVPKIESKKRREDSVKKNTTVQDMIAALNKVTGWDVKLDREMAPMLKAAFDRKFNQSMEKWVEYIRYKIFKPQKIFNVKLFLLKNLLKFDKIDIALAAMAATVTIAIPTWGDQVRKVLEFRKTQTGQNSGRINQILEENKMRNILPEIKECGGVGAKIKNSFEKKYGRAPYLVHVKDLAFERTDSGGLICNFPTQERKDFIFKHYPEWIERLASEYGMITWKIKGESK